MHTVAIEQRKRIVLTGVEGVVSFSPQQIRLLLSDGKLSIAGEGLKIISFSETSGDFSATGKIEELRYGGGTGLKFFK